MLLRNADAYGIWTSIDGDSGRKERDYLDCRHCGRSWEVKPGSGNTRGWCTLCAGPTCGSLACRPHVPYMEKFEAEEKRLQQLVNSQEYQDRLLQEIEAQLQRQAMLAEVNK